MPAFPSASAAYGPSPTFWNDKKVFVTGHTGFKGSWLTLWLASLGAKVHGYSLPPNTSPSLFESLVLADMCEHETADIRDPGRMQAALQSFRPDIVIHMAAQPFVLTSYRQPVETFATNVQGTVNLLDACRTVSPRAILAVTTDKCYQNRELQRPYGENEPLGGDDPYSASKACTELAVHAWRHSFFPDRQDTVLTSARAGNIFGGGDWGENRLIPDAVKAFTENRALVLRNPAAVRPWQHVTAPLCGYLMLAERMFIEGHAFAIPFNFGPGDDDVLTVRELVSIFASFWGSGARFEEHSDAANPHETNYLSLDSTRAHTMLDWRSSADTAEDLQTAADLYKLFYGGASAGQLREACLAAIARETASRNRQDGSGQSRVA